MVRPILLCLTVFATSVAVASDPNEVARSRADTYKRLAPTKDQAAALHKIDSKYDALLTKLRKDKPADYLIKRDALNEKYTHDFMAAMTPLQKSDYRKYIRSLRQSFIKAHPEVDADNIYIWGGANLL